MEFSKKLNQYIAGSYLHALNPFVEKFGEDIRISFYDDDTITTFSGVKDFKANFSVYKPQKELGDIVVKINDDFDWIVDFTNPHLLKAILRNKELEEISEFEANSVSELFTKMDYHITENNIFDETISNLFHKVVELNEDSRFSEKQFHELSDEDLLIETVCDNSFKLFTKSLAIEIGCRIILDDEDSDSGTWFKEYYLDDLTNQYFQKSNDSYPQVVSKIFKIVDGK